MCVRARAPLAMGWSSDRSMDRQLSGDRAQALARLYAVRVSFAADAKAALTSTKPCVPDCLKAPCLDEDF